MRGRRETLGAPVTLVLAALTAALALPGSGGANPPVTALHTRETRLGGKAHAALLDLYSLDTRLAQSRARAAALRTQAANVRMELAAVKRQEVIARRAWRLSVEALESHLRTLYESGESNALGVLLGAASIDDALTRLDFLERAARLDRDTIVETRQARTQLTQLRGALEHRSQQLVALATKAGQTTAQLSSARAARVTYVAALARQRSLTARKIAQLQAQAAASAARRPPVVAAPAAAPSAAAQHPDAAAALSTAGTLTVTATGYSLAGHTATGLPVGWGVVAVDPSVIPLGTHLTIPGYGEGVAADTGGAVQGTAIDLWFPTQAQAHAWGRRTVTILLH